MGEDLDQERFRIIRQTAEKLKGLGKPTRNRREDVIASVAAERLDQEDPEVKEGGINKYFAGEIGSKEIHGVVDSLHSGDPGDNEAALLLKQLFPDLSREDLVQYYRLWRADPKKVPDFEISEISKKGLMRACRKIWNRVERPVNDITRAVAGGCNASWWIAKKSRLWADANRRSFFHEPRGVDVGIDKEAELLQTKEYPTSARAALYWAISKTIEGTVGLDDSGQVKAPFLRLGLHGMTNRRQADVVIGGGDLKLGDEGKLASEKVLRWFGKTLVEKIAERGIRVELGDDESRKRIPIVAIHRRDPRVEILGKKVDGEVVSTYVERDGASLSGAGLGLEHFRTGQKFTVKDVDGKERDLYFPGFGKEFHTIQLELSNRVRKNPEVRQVFEEVLAEMMVEFSERFSKLGTSLD